MENTKTRKCENETLCSKIRVHSMVTRWKCDLMLLMTMGKENISENRTSQM
jgi:hypothetical protein